jgi:probable HAF family extracellular repeat protein
MRRFVSIAVGGVIALLGRVAPADEPFFMGLGDLPGGHGYSEAQAVSADGVTVVGTGRGADDTSEAFRWTVIEGIEGLGRLPGGSFSRAEAVSADGSTIVGWSGTAGAAFEAFRWSRSDGMVGLGFLPGGGYVGSQALGTSADGSLIVGVSDSSTGYARAFRWTQTEGMVGLPDLSGEDGFSEAIGVSADGAVIVGQSEAESGIEACRWTGDGVFGLGSLPGGEHRSLARAASADGSVVVGGSRSAFSGPDAWEAFRWTEQAGMMGLGDLPGGSFDSFACGTSADGSVLVGAGESERGREACIWDAEHGMRSLYDVLTDDFDLDLTGWNLTVAMGISDNGQTIVGFGTNPNGDTEAWIARIPEPASVALFAFGAVATLRRQR